MTDASEPTLPTFAFTLNGQEVEVAVDPKASVLDVLRGTLGVLTMKAGCSPQGLCGCCTALVDGKARLTCTLPVKSLAGKAVTTLESVDPAVRDALAKAFAAEGGAQCGYCTPGIALSASTLLSPGPAQNLNPTDDELHRALAPHLCRCTGYTGILDSVRLAASALRGEVSLVDSDRPEAREQILGERPFVDDLVRPGMIHAVLVWAPGPAGAVAIAEGEGIRALTTEVSAADQPVALVWGASEAEAKARAKALVIGFEPREFGSGGLAPTDAVTPTGPGTHVSAQVRAAPTDPVYLEPEAVLVVPTCDGQSFTLYTASQSPAAELAAVRGVSGVAVLSRTLPSGGSYGGKTNVLPAVLATELAMQTGQPVRLSLDLEQGMRLHGRRPGGDATAAVSGDGRIRRIVGHGDTPYACEIEGSTLDRSAVQVRGAGVVLATLAVERAVDGFARATRQDPFLLRAGSATAAAQALLDVLRTTWQEDGHRGVGLARGGTGFGEVRVIAQIASGSEITLHCNVAELGQGRDAALVRIVALSSGLDPAVFTVPWGDPDVTGPDAWGPVEAAARRCGAALRAVGGPLGDHVGERIVGEAAPAEVGTAAAVVRLGPEGELVAVYIAVPCGEDQDPLDVRRVAEGSAHMGVGVALSEEVATMPGGLPETRFRMLGVLKSKLSPKILAKVVVGGPPVDSADAAMAATVAAIVNAVAAFEGSARSSVPMKDSAAAKSVGVRVRPG